jgi:hypothetical protein
MPTYTVKIEASGDREIWQALAPAETVEDDGTAAEVAAFVAGNQTVAKSGVWRVRVWIGDDTGVEPAAEYERSEAEVADELLGVLTRITSRRTKLIEELDAQRDSLVRELMRTSVARKRIASAADVSEPRLYQIRDGRR